MTLARDVTERNFLPSQKARQVNVMHCHFVWVCMYVCMYVCISADCAMQFYACVCISTTLAQYNPMLAYVYPSPLRNYYTIPWPKCARAPDYCLACVARILWKNTTSPCPAHCASHMISVTL